MKTRKFQKKLSLNKATIADLSNKELSKIDGAGIAPPIPCRDTDDRSNCPTGWTCPSGCSGMCC
jgi:hypothetical protein